MKVKSLTILFTLIFAVAFTQGITCEKRLSVARDYLSKYENFESGLVQEIITNVGSCLDGSAVSNYVEGMSLLYTSQSETDIAEAFELIKSSAEQNLKEACSALGTLYKQGKGCDIDFNEAVNWFEQAASLGDEKAKYSLGYMYMKGHGTIEQDYALAIHWFEESNYAMAKHWLGVCKLYGLGIQQDEVEAILDLEDNLIDNSTYLLEQLNSEVVFDSVSIDEDYLDVLIAMESQTNSGFYVNLGQETHSVTYNGILAEYDWSGTNVLKSHPVNISLDKTTNDSFQYVFSFGDVEFSNSGFFYNDEAYLEELSIDITNAYSDRPEYNVLHNEVTSIFFQRQMINGKSYIIGNILSWNQQMNEPGPIMKLILEDTYFGLTMEEVEGLNAQSGQVIKIYPNPFDTQFLIQYELEEDATVSLQLNELHGNINIPILSSLDETAGKKIVRFDNPTLPVGVYVLTLTQGNSVSTKLIVKQ